METLWQDLKFGLRMLARSPGFTAVAVLTLALGIGANTAIFSLVNAVLLRPLPYRAPEQLVMLWDAPAKSVLTSPTSPARYLDWSARNSVFTEVAAVEDSEISNKPKFFMTGGDAPERIRGALVSANLFSLLGVEPQFGRTFQPEEEQAGRDQVAVISDALWRRRFGADPEITRKTISLNHKTYAVIGVMPPGFKWNYPRACDLWAPLVISPSERNQRGSISYKVVARLKPGVTLELARGEMKNLSASLAQEYPRTDSRKETVVVPMHERLFAQTRKPLVILMTAVGFVLLLACTNLANLALAQATGRGREMALRAALGAGRLRLLRQMLSECVLIALAGGACGALLAWWGRDLVVYLLRDTFPRGDEVGIDGWVLGFTAAISVLAGLLFGLVPAWQASRTHPMEALKAGAAGATSGLRAQRLRGVLVAAEAALAVVLLAGAGLMIQSLRRLTRVELGFNPSQLLTMQFTLPYYKYKDPQFTAETVARILARVKTIASVELVAASDSIPLTGRDPIWRFEIPGHPSSQPDGQWNSNHRAVSPDFFRALGIQLVVGRVFSERDGYAAPKVAVITESLAKLSFPNEDPVGQFIEDSQIVGVVSDARFEHPTLPVGPTVYQPMAQHPAVISVSLIVRTSGEPLRLATAVQKAIWAEDPEQPIENVTTVEQIVADSVSDTRFYSFMLGAFALVSLALSALGIHGVVAYTVSQRTREIGIRMALGALPRDVLRMIVRQEMTLAFVGVVAGLGAALGLTRFLRAMLFEVKPTDPATFFAVAVLLAAIALAACWIPARRATRVDPMVALHYE